MTETFTEQLRRQTRERLGVCPTCGQPTRHPTREMGEILGVPHSTIWRFLRGSEPSAALINRLVVWLVATPERPADERGGT